MTEVEVAKVKVEIVSKEKAGVEVEGPTRPSWLNETFMQEALRRDGHHHALLEDFEVSYALPPGNNFCRVKLNLRGRSNPLVLLVKALPAGEHWAKMLQEQGLFEKESIVFSRVLPAMDALLAEAAPGQFPPFAAHCLHHGEQPSPFIVLQDLGPEDFRMANRVKGLDLGHALLALTALGRFHGASAALWRRRPELFEELTNPFDDEVSVKEAENYSKSVGNLAKAMEKWTDLPGDYDKKIDALKDSFYEELQVVNRQRPGKFNVFIHGDFWLNNMLFSYDENTVSGVRFVDFQVSHMGNLAIDLFLFKYTSIEEEVLDNHWDTLLEAYIDSLTWTLKTLGEEAPTAEDIQRDMVEARFYCLFVAFFMLPVIRKEEGTYDMEKAAESGDWSADLDESEIFHYWMKKLLPEFSQMGIFDDYNTSNGNK